MKHSKHFVPKEKVPTAPLRERDMNVMRAAPTRRQQKESAMAAVSIEGELYKEFNF